MRRLALPIAAVCLAALVAVASARLGGAPAARAQAVAASGDFQISNSDAGQPIFAATGIGPGDSARGTVEIAATGSVPVELTLSRHDLLDAPGHGGGLLSAALTLTVTDVTAPAAPRPVYAGPLDSMPAQAAGRLEPGGSRTYAFVAALPAGGAGGDQNAVQGASVSVAYSWTATEAAAADDSGPEPGPPRAAPSGPPPAIAAPPAPLPGGGLELTLTRAAKVLRGGRLTLWARCDSACAIAARGRLRASAGGRHRGARVRFARPPRYRAGTQKLRIRVPGKLRRWLAAAPGKRHLRARIVLTAFGPAGTAPALRRTLRLQPPRRRLPRPLRAAAVLSGRSGPGVG
jgi:hypothetical protein